MYEQKLAYEGIFDVVMKEANSPFYKHWFASEYAPDAQDWTSKKQVKRNLKDIIDEICEEFSDPASILRAAGMRCEPAMACLKQRA